MFHIHNINILQANTISILLTAANIHIIIYKKILEIYLQIIICIFGIISSNSNR